MNKFIKWSAIVIGSLALLLFIAFKFMQASTKKASPETTAVYQEGEKDIKVVYSQPSKKGREIFGNLVPFGTVWRTGANEATTFTTKNELVIDGKLLPAGTYTLWTIPEADKWTVIFNSKDYSWGVNFDSEASREPEADVLTLDVPVQNISSAPMEKFTIAFDKTTPSMDLIWDKTKVSVPFN